MYDCLLGTACANYPQVVLWMRSLSYVSSQTQLILLTFRGPTKALAVELSIPHFVPLEKSYSCTGPRLPKQSGHTPSSSLVCLGLRECLRSCRAALEVLIRLACRHVHSEDEEVVPGYQHAAQPGAPEQRPDRGAQHHDQKHPGCARPGGEAGSCAPASHLVPCSLSPQHTTGATDRSRKLRSGELCIWVCRNAGAICRLGSRLQAVR